MSSSKHVKFSASELEALSAWTAWEDFGVVHSDAEPADVGESHSITVEQIEAIQKQAYDEAFALGKEEGFKVGRGEGVAEGQNEGFEAGKRQGYEESVHLLQEQAALFEQLMEALNEPFKCLDQSVEEELAKLAITIARQIVRREIKQEPGQIIGLIREAITMLPSASRQVTVSLHPDDAELVRSALKLDGNMPQTWRIQENPLLTRGGCLVETDVSSIDATLERRMSAVVAGMLGDERQQDGWR